MNRWQSRGWRTESRVGSSMEADYRVRSTDYGEGPRLTRAGTAPRAVLATFHIHPNRQPLTAASGRVGTASRPSSPARAQLAQVGAWLRRALLLAECKAKPCPYPRSPSGELDPRLARSANPTRGKQPQAAHNPLSPCHLAHLSLTAPHFCTVAQAEGRLALLHLGQHVVLSLPPCFPRLVPLPLGRSCRRKLTSKKSSTCAD